MKITCNSCGSKYTIADAKVQGKKVKVRCKGCKESILVDGTAIGEGGSDDDSSDDLADVESAPEAAAAAPAKQPLAKAPGKPAGGKANLWSVNITDDDSRDMTLDELVKAWNSGLVTSDAYVWKDGMGDWKPILEVGELKLKLGAPKKPGGVISSVTAPKAGAEKMGDLFGGADDAAAMPSESTAKAAAAGDGGKPTGARNDSSVLFSLDSLKGGAASGGSASKDRADDLFGGLGAGPAGPLTGNIDLLTAPAKEPPPAPAGARVVAPVAQESKGKGPLIAAIIGAAVIIGGAIVFFGGQGGAEAESEKEATAQGPSEADKKDEEERKKMAEELQKMKDDLKAARDEALKAGKDPDKAEVEKKAEQDKEKEAAEAKEKAAKEAATATAPSAEKPSTGSSSASSSAPAPAAAPATAAGGAAFDVGAAKAALEAAAANAAACGSPGGPTGAGKVQVTFASSGRVTSANVVSGPFGGTAVGGCVASTFRRARVPAFSGEPKTVAKSFSVQ